MASHGAGYSDKSVSTPPRPTRGRPHSYQNSPVSHGYGSIGSHASGPSPSTATFRADEVLTSLPVAPYSLRSSSAGSTGRRGSYWLSLTEEFDVERGRTEEGRTHFVHPPASMLTPQMRSQRLIGNSNPRYRWRRYFQSEEDLKKMKAPVREYYERNNSLVQQYIYIDKLLDSSLPHNLIQEYHHLPHSHRIDVPPTITEEGNNGVGSAGSRDSGSLNDSQSGRGSDTESGPSDNPGAGPSQLNSGTGLENGKSTGPVAQKIKRTPRNLYKIPTEETHLLARPEGNDDDDDGEIVIPEYIPGDDDVETTDSIVMLAIRINFVVNVILLAMKIVITVMTSSVSVLASLVDAVLDFLSTAIVWTTTALISRQDHYSYPAGRRRLEPIGVLVFSVIMTTSFFQVGIEGLDKLTSGAREVVRLPAVAIGIMGATVVVKLGCWFWCRMIKNSSVQALAQDAMTDVIFNTFSIIFPLTGHFFDIWWLDPVGGILLSLYVIINWTSTSFEHIRNLAGAAATADERNVLLYLTMRFAKTIKQIQGLQAYHAGDKLIVEVDIVVDENMALRDSHDLGESLQYVLESVPIVDRAFVHLDYASYNLPTHMKQQEG